MKKMRRKAALAFVGAVALGAAANPMRSQAQTVTFQPYIQPGDNGAFGPTDQMVIAWQTDETAPNVGAFTVSFTPSVLTAPTFVTPKGRVVDNYLTADPTLASLAIPTAYGAHTDYYALLAGLAYDTTYNYTVTGPNGYALSSAFHTRKKTNTFSFEVQGDEGFYPNISAPNPNAGKIENWEARIIHAMLHVSEYTFPNTPGYVPAGGLPKPEFALNTGDNVYTVGSDANYRDWWMDVWNSDADNNDDGAPFIRQLPLYITVGNHDVGSTGATANLLADSGATTPGGSGPGLFGGGVSGGDALAHFNNFYFPLNGPVGADIQNVFTGDAATPSGIFYNYNGKNYSPAPTAGTNVSANTAATTEAYRASTTVDTGKGPKRQIDHESNYSFDYGNAHFLFLDANPHVFGGFLPGGPPGNAPSFPFTTYPALLRDFAINDLDSSKATWKFVVFHQPSFSSGNATIANDQMRRTAKYLEDHGVNMVFNGHEHNYQRSLPIRALPGVDATPNKAGGPVVAVDTTFNGVTQTVPSGVLYFIEGAGGDRDFDNNLPNPRGSSGIDQDDSATGTFAQKVNNVTYNFATGQASWLDTNLTTDAMKAFVPGAGSGSQKITTKFKSKLFSFADITIADSLLTLYQVSEPLSNVSSGTFGADINGAPVNDPLPDTLIDPATGNNVQTTGAAGTPTLLDKIMVTKPNVTGSLLATLAAPAKVQPNGALVYTIQVVNNTAYTLTGVQAVITLPAGVVFADTLSPNLTLQGADMVATMGAMAPGSQAIIQVKARVTAPIGTVLSSAAAVRSATALPVALNPVTTTVVRGTPAPPK